jgi:hypothetical protein
MSQTQNPCNTIFNIKIIVAFHRPHLSTNYNSLKAIKIQPSTLDRDYLGHISNLLKLSKSNRAQVVSHSHPHPHLHLHPHTCIRSHTHTHSVRSVTPTRLLQRDPVHAPFAPSPLRRHLTMVQKFKSSISKIHILPKVWIFSRLWLVSHNKIMTRDNLKMWDMIFCGIWNCPTISLFIFWSEEKSFALSIT